MWQLHKHLRLERPARASPPTPKPQPHRLTSGHATSGTAQRWRMRSASSAKTGSQPTRNWCRRCKTASTACSSGTWTHWPRHRKQTSSVQRGLAPLRRSWRTRTNWLTHCPVIRSLCLTRCSKRSRTTKVTHSYKKTGRSTSLHWPSALASTAAKLRSPHLNSCGPRSPRPLAWSPTRSSKHCRRPVAVKPRPPQTQMRQCLSLIHPSWVERKAVSKVWARLPQLAGRRPPRRKALQRKTGRSQRSVRMKLTLSTSSAWRRPRLDWTSRSTKFSVRLTPATRSTFGTTSSPTVRSTLPT